MLIFKLPILVPTKTLITGSKYYAWSSFLQGLALILVRVNSRVLLVCLKIKWRSFVTYSSVIDALLGVEEF